MGYGYDLTNGRLKNIIGVWPADGGPQPNNWYPDTTFNIYDGAGQVRYSGWRQFYYNPTDPPTTAGMARRASASFYAADGKLMVQQQNRDSISYTYGTIQKQRGSYEEYWYDALGRRVLVRRRSDQLCSGGSTFCISTIERFVWDGDQLLYELRAPGGDNLSGAQLDAVPPYTGSSQIGVVAYTHGAGIDAPLDLIREEYNSSEYVVIPHQNWRGQYGAGTDPTGAQYQFNFEWPADFRGPYFQGGDGWGDEGLPDWFGSLIQDQEGQTGLQYKRNRYYDPQTGQFTQEDPIGLAGGLNLYGFASGDPVTFGDPFGLCPKDAGGDGKTDSFADCPEGSSGWYANRIATGEGSSLLNNVGGVLASCGESWLCQGALAVFSLGASLAVEAPAAGGIAAVRLGQAGEAAVAAVEDIGPKLAIQVGGRARIPDGLNLVSKVLTEVKNVGSLSFTQQLRDFAAYSQAKGLRFDLWVRAATELSGPLKQAVRSGIINLLVIP